MTSRFFRVGDRVRFTQAAVDVDFFGYGRTFAWRGWISGLDRWFSPPTFATVEVTEGEDDGMLGVTLDDEELGACVFGGGASWIEHDDGPRPVVVYEDGDRGDEQPAKPAWGR